DPATEFGLRERAVVVLVARLGLRAGEVIRLKLDDLDWIEGRLIIRAGKNHCERILPLSQEVGEALVAYLRQARRATSHREIFLSFHPPFGPLRSSSSITTLVGTVLKRAGIKVHRPGAHVLRHYADSRTMPSESPTDCKIPLCKGFAQNYQRHRSA